MNENIALVQSFYAAFNRGDIPFILERFTPDCEWDFEGPAEIPAAAHCRGIGEIAKVFQAIAASETGHNLHMTEFIADGNVVVSLGTVTGTAKSTGRTHTIPMAHVFRIRDGKVYYHGAYANTHAWAASHKPQASAAGR